MISGYGRCLLSLGPSSRFCLLSFLQISHIQPTPSLPQKVLVRVSHLRQTLRVGCISDQYLLEIPSSMFTNISAEVLFRHSRAKTTGKVVRSADAFADLAMDARPHDIQVTRQLPPFPISTILSVLGCPQVTMGSSRSG